MEFDFNTAGKPFRRHEFYIERTRYTFYFNNGIFFGVSAGRRQTIFYRRSRAEHSLAFQLNPFNRPGINDVRKPARRRIGENASIYALSLYLSPKTF